MSKEVGETYIGDGLYAAVVNGSVRLRAPREGGDHLVYLEPDVLVEFERFIASLRSGTKTG